MTGHLWGNLAEKILLATVLLTGVMIVSLACGGGDDSLTVYSGRSQSLVDPVMKAFMDETGVDVRVKYAGSAAIAATVLEEGGQHAGRLGLSAGPGLPGQHIGCRTPGGTPRGIAV